MAIGSVRAFKKFRLSLVIVEAYAIMVAIQFCKENGFTDLVLEGDSLQVFLKMQNPVKDWSQGGFILEDVKLSWILL